MLKFIRNILIFILKKSIELIEKIEYRKYDLDEENISKKILNTLNTKFKVLTDTGYESVDNIHITQPYIEWKIETENGYFLQAADNHILFDFNFGQVFIKDLKIKDFIQTDVGPQRVVSITKNYFRSSMFDLSVNSPNHRFYTNGILSHNTICSSITILHYVLFNNNKNVLVTANILDTAVEILSKIREIYQSLPFFLQQGIVNWNQKFMVFENKSRIKGFATTKTSSIGQAADFLYLDEFAHIPDATADKFYKSVFPTVSNIDNSKIIITSTPNGYNLFHRLLTDAEKPESEKSSYAAKRVYWWQVPKRFVTYIKLDSRKLEDLGIKRDTVMEYLQQKYENNKSEIKYDSELKKWVIHVFNNDDCTEEDILKEEISGIRFLEFSDITTWKKEAIKNIGGEDAFNQEYDLRFINSSRNILSEAIIDKINKNKKEYEWIPIENLDRLKFSYKDLHWVKDQDLFDINQRLNYKIVMSIDISEGLGQDYSIINIFKISPKDSHLINRQKSKYKSLVDFVKLEQIGMFRSNLTSVSQLSEILYLICFEFFNPDNVKVVLEINTYGNELLAHLPNVFDGKNNYGSSIFFRYKHRQDAQEEKIGIKIGDNKNLLVKEYQERMEMESIYVNNIVNITEVTTFIKHVTSAGNIRYAADGSSNDDTVMTLVSLSSVFGKPNFNQIVDDFIQSSNNSEFKSLVDEFMSSSEYIEPINYSQILDIRRRKMNSNVKSDVSENSVNEWLAKLKR